MRTPAKVVQPHPCAGATYSVEMKHGRPRRVVDGGCPAWSPDGKKLAFVSSRGIAIVNADGTGKRQLTRPRKGTDLFPSWSADGRLIGFLRDEIYVGSVYTINVGGGEPREQERTELLPDYGPSEGPIAWAPSGHQFVFSICRVYEPPGSHGGQATLTCDIEIVSADNGRKSRLTQSSNGSAATDPAWAADGLQIAYVPPSARGFVILRKDGTVARRLRLNPPPDTLWFTGRPLWSPDSTRLAFTGSPSGIGRRVIYVVKSHGGSVTRVGYGSVAENDHAWSRSGEFLALSSQRSTMASDTHIYVVRTDGTGRKQLTTGSVIDTYPTWRP